MEAIARRDDATVQRRYLGRNLGQEPDSLQLFNFIYSLHSSLSRSPSNAHHSVLMESVLSF
eukprot:1159441-Pelagomonas_calceolata.AAC.11